MDPGRVSQAGHVSGQASPQPFNVAVRGYDRHQVNEHIRQLENQARQLRELERPGDARPGSHVERLLRLAEEQIAKIVQESRSAADELQAAAKVDAAELRAAAENEVSELRSGRRTRSERRRGGSLTS
jgi:dsDNA-specific endonuclease/ATPase MutS2